MATLATQRGKSAASAPGAPGSLAGYLLEWKLDGLRCIGVRNGPSVDLFSRNHLSFGTRYPGLVRALAALPPDTLTVDGEIIGLVGGRPDFGALVQGAAEGVEYWLFDITFLLGHDVRHLPIEERKALLARIVPLEGTVRLAPSLEGNPLMLFRRSCEDGWEGLVAKRKGSAYCSGRSSDWLKLKCACRQELVVGGWTRPRGSRRGLGALLVGYYEQGELRFAGKVGTGFSTAVLEDLHDRLSVLEQATCPFVPAPRERQVHWCRPQLVAEVAFGNWTADGRLRHPSFVALREDKMAGEVLREGSVPQARPRRS